MKNSFANKINGKAAINTPEIGILIFIFMITFKTCNMPSVLYGTSKESGVWCILIHAILDGLLLVLSLYVAKMGGIRSKSIPESIRKVSAVLLFLFFLLKLTAFSYEVTSSISSVIFDNALCFPILFLVLTTSALIGSKGFTGVGRTALLFGWLAIFILVFNLIFIGFDGFGYNLYPIFRPNNVFTGILKEAFWFGEPLILMICDFSERKHTKKGFIIFAYVASVVVLIGFYLLLIFTYGSLSSVNNAFSRVLTMNKYSNELGAVDWPIIILWLVMALLHTSAIFSAIKQCFSEIINVEGKRIIKQIAFYIVTLTVPILAYALVFRESNYTSILSSLPVGVITLLVSYVIPFVIAVIIFVKTRKDFIKNKERLYEKEK